MNEKEFLNTHTDTKNIQKVHNGCFFEGFSVVEIIVYAAIFTVVFIAITNAIVMFYKTNRNALEQVAQVDSGRRGIATMVNELREANYSELGVYPIITVSTSSITFYSDYDNDGFVEKVRYYLSGTDFKRGVVEPGNPVTYGGTELSTTLSSYVRNATQGVNIFYYYDMNGSLMSTPYSLVNIRYIQVKLIVNVNVVTLPNEFMLRSSATLRNLKSNL